MNVLQNQYALEEATKKLVNLYVKFYRSLKDYHLMDDVLLLISKNINLIRSMSV